ncbi:MAG: hypothetical protein WCS65_13020 [Verrucomicrobiae bacterium]
MNVLATSPLRAQQLDPAASQPASKKATAESKLKESCRQFEAVLWRSVLDKANSAQADRESAGGEASDKAGTYQYFINDTLANSVSGLPSSFSSVLFASLSPHLAQDSKTNNPS